MSTQFRPVQPPNAHPAGSAAARAAANGFRSVSGGFRPLGAGDGAVPAPPGGVKYAGDPKPAVDRSKRCRGNDDTCMAWRIKDSEFCVGHNRALVEAGDNE